MKDVLKCVARQIVVATMPTHVTYWEPGHQSRTGPVAELRELTCHSHLTLSTHGGEKSHDMTPSRYECAAGEVW